MYGWQTTLRYIHEVGGPWKKTQGISQGQKRLLAEGTLISEIGEGKIIKPQAELGVILRWILINDIKVR